MRDDLRDQISQTELLHQLLSAKYVDGQKALASALRRRGKTTSICWYPSAGDCFRDLWAWDQWRPYRIPAPRLFIHTDYQGPCSGIDSSDPHHDAMRIEERHSLALQSDVFYEVSSSYAASAGFAAPEPKVELLLLSIDPEILNKRRTRQIVPVLYFYFENINWFESMIFSKGLKFSHFFKRQEGLNGGGSRASVMNLFPYFGSSGCRHLLLDPEIQIDHGLIKRMWVRYYNHARSPFHLVQSRHLRDRSLDSLEFGTQSSITKTMRHFRLIHIRNSRSIEPYGPDGNGGGPVPAWLEGALKKITYATPWNDKFSAT